MANQLSCSKACVIFPDQVSNQCPLHWQADFIHCTTKKVHVILILFFFFLPQACGIFVLWPGMESRALEVKLLNSSEILTTGTISEIPSDVMLIKKGQDPREKGTGRRRQWQSTPVLLPGKSHGWRSLVGCSPWGC